VPKTLDEFNLPYFKRDPYSGVEYCTKCGFERAAGHGATCPAYPENRKPFSIGSKVWAYDRHGHGYNKFDEETVVAETKMSWVTDRNHKLPKRHGDTTSVVISTGSKRYPASTRYWFDFEAFADSVWLDENHHFIIEKLRRATLSPAQWREIADLIDYREGEK
jgi:hypothetical protein